MHNLEKSCLSQLSFQPVFFKKFLDDILTCIPADKIENALHVFNNENENLKFTYEKENNNMIYFLGMTVIYDKII